MKYLFLKLIIIICAFNLQLNAQTYFNNLYPYHSQVANATAEIQVDTGGYVFPSCTFGTYTSLLILKINSYGDTLLTREYIKPSCSFSLGSSNSIILSYDNEYVFSGSILDSTNNRDALLVKLTENGDTIWTKTYGGTNFDNANTVCQTPDSGFVLMGVTQSFSNGPAADFYLIKTDKNGNFQWQHAYGTTAAEDCVSGQVTLDGGYIMAGHRNGELHIVKTDALGTFKWEKVYSGTAGQAFIKQLADSTYIMVGAKNVSGLAGQAYIAKLTKTGTIIWQQTYGGTGDQQFYAVPVILNDGSIVCSGVSTVGSSTIGLLIKTDSSGNQQWLRTYYFSLSYPNYIYDVKHTADNGFILSGFGAQPWLVKVDSVGCEVAGCNIGVKELGANNEEFEVYPNPATSEIMLATNHPLKAIHIYNVLGEEVLELERITTSEKAIDISTWKAGVYFIEIETEKGVARKKLVKE